MLDQKSKHLNSVLQKAKNVPISETDADNLRKEISELKTSVDKLFSKSEDIMHRTLKYNRNESNTLPGKKN